VDALLRFAEYFNSPIMFKGYIAEDHDAGLQASNGLFGREALFTHLLELSRVGDVHLGFTILRAYEEAQCYNLRVTLD